MKATRTRRRSITINALSHLPSRFQKPLTRAFKRVVQSHRFLEGKENQALAARLRTLVGGGHVVPVASGHDAIVLALKALGISSRDEVVVPALAYPTAFAAAQSGATVVAADVDQNGQLSVSSLKRAITKKTKVVVVVHLFGHVGDLGSIRALLYQKKIALVEDCAQAMGSKFAGKSVGTFGTIGCFSFYPTKILGALGDGGAIWTRSPRIAAFLRQAKSYGETIQYQSKFISFHSRLPELQAASLLVSFSHLPQWMHKRKALYNIYRAGFMKAGLGTYIRVLESNKQTIPVPLELAVVATRRNALKKYLSARGIESVVHYPIPFPFVSAFSYLGYTKGDFPQAEKLSQELLSLPLHPFLSQSEVTLIIDALCSFYHV
jgi:dTDP-4-amino-4,6-dideoxygalactose transaminase